MPLTRGRGVEITDARLDLPAAQVVKQCCPISSLIPGMESSPLPEGVIPTQGICFRSTLPLDSLDANSDGFKWFSVPTEFARGSSFRLLCSSVALKGSLKHKTCVLPLVSLNQHLQAGALAAILHKLTGD